MSDINNTPELPSVPGTSVALDFCSQVRASIAELEQAILSAHPTMPQLLRTIHSQLKKDPEVTTLLSEDEIGVVVQGLIMQTNTAVGEAQKAKRAPKKALDLDMF